MSAQTLPTAYETRILEWRQSMEDKLRAEDGWLTLAGLFWLRPGINTLGSDPTADIMLDCGDVPPRLGVIEFDEGQASLSVTAECAVTVDGTAVQSAVLRHDHADGGPSLIRIGSLTAFIIQRGADYGVRVRDSRHPARETFAGRHWFPIDPTYQTTGRFVAHAEPRLVHVMTSAENQVPLTAVGRVEFALQGRPLALEALESAAGELWFIFRDGTSGATTYGGGRFMNAPLADDGTVALDFNTAYHPPCAFTAFATCPRPLPENHLPLEIQAGEHL